MLYTYDADLSAIQERLLNGAALVACLCTLRCHKCPDWLPVFSALSGHFPDACFVWLDIDEHPDMVADIPGLISFPFILVRTDRVTLAQAVEPDSQSLISLVRTSLNQGAAQDAPSIQEPSLYSFLLE